MWLKQGIICNNLANIVVKSKEEIKKKKPKTLAKLLKIIFKGVYL